MEPISGGTDIYFPGQANKKFLFRPHVAFGKITSICRVKRPRTGRGQVQIITVLSRKAFQQSSRVSKLVLQDPKFALKKF
jgi:hypothetical protein